MNPYLENPELWSAVHNRLIVTIADDLVDCLSDSYRVEIEKRTYFSSDETVLVGIPDVAVLTGKTAEPTSSVATVSSSPRHPVSPNYGYSNGQNITPGTGELGIAKKKRRKTLYSASRR